MRGNGFRRLMVGAAAVLTASLSAGSASADPAVLPQARDLVGVGAETTQGLMSRLSVDYNAYLAGKGDTASPRLYGWDATGPSPLTPKTGADTIVRPDGAAAGIRALNTRTATTIDYTRSDRGPQVSDPHGLDFVVLAKDAVTWSAAKDGNAPAQLTQRQLSGIYTCNITNWQQIDPSLPNATIRPYLPQADSGTRASFLTAFGGLAVNTACVTTGPEENEGTDPALQDPNVVFPYSVGEYLGQTVGGHATATQTPGALTLRSIVMNGTTLSPVTDNHLDAVFSNSPFGRAIYNVFRDADWNATDAHGTTIQDVFGPSGWICNDPVAAADLTSYGFQPLLACGYATLT
ncbi:substrate-binding domain-containing protein [Kitasatospora sp. NPDC096077]|uniref:PstS family phosphate ABC transporter substrate-binding protein n=1 Tax=Kitasatospora sp. NPDC096077 TaxID=3155544 RepID=UPI0033213832